MINTKRFNLIYYLIVATLGYTLGLYIKYSKILDEESDKPKSSYGTNKCYKYKKIERQCK